MKRLTKKDKNYLAQLVGQEIDAELLINHKEEAKYLIGVWEKLTQLPQKQKQSLLDAWEEQL